MAQEIQSLDVDWLSELFVCMQKMKVKRLFPCSSCTSVHLKKKKGEKEWKQGQFYHKGGEKKNGRH